MADLLPSSPDPSADDGGEPRVIGVDSEDADDLLAALQSETARDLLATLYDEPAAPSALAEEADTSIQNVRYHLEKLADADLVEVADTIYSEKGREMKVYAPTAKPLVVFAGHDDETPGIEAALSRLLGGLGVLGLSSLVVQRLVGGPNAVIAPDVDFQGGAAEVTTEAENVTGPAGDAGSGTEVTSGATTEAESDVETVAEDDVTTETVTEGAGPNGAGTETVEKTTEATRTVAETTRTVTESAPGTETAQSATETTRVVAETTPVADEFGRATTTSVADAGGTAASGLPPGLLFFAGGLVVLLALGVAWYLRAR